MNRMFLSALLASLLFAAPSFAGPLEDFEDGVAAQKRGDYATALRLWKPLAEKGISTVQYNLGLLYAQGHGVTQDYAEAKKWWHKAAEQGVAEAQGSLGILYLEGKGVPQNFVQAHMWFNLMAAQGDEHAIKLRNFVASQMTPAQIAEAQKLARQWKPKK